MVLSEDTKGITVYVVEGEKLDRACLFPGSPSREEEKRLWVPSGIVQSRKRVSMGLTVNRQMGQKLTVNRQKRNIFTVNRQMSEPKLAVKFLRYPLTIETD